MKQLADYICSIPDFPKPGIIFRDITPLIENADGFSRAVDEMVEKSRSFGPIDKIAAPEARGFIFGAALARQLNAGFVPMRKPGKLPRPTVSTSYALEYGTNELHIHTDSIRKGERILLIDDLLATGGTMLACRKLIEGQGGIVVGCGFVIELTDLHGRDLLCPAASDFNIFSLITFEGE